MPRYNVEYNGKWACFSSIVDAFVTPLMEKDEYEQWRLAEYGAFDYRPAEQCNRMTMDDAVFGVRLNRPFDEALENLLEVGLDNDIAIALLNAQNK